MENAWNFFYQILFLQAIYFWISFQKVSGKVFSCSFYDKASDQCVM